MTKSIKLTILTVLVAVSAQAGVASAATANLVPSCTVSATPAAITSAQSALLKWDSTEGAIFTSIDSGIGNVGVDGELTVSPSISTVYTVHTWNSQGDGGYCSVALTVDGAGVVTVANQPTVSLQTLTVHPAATRVVLQNVPYTGAAENVIYTLFLLSLSITAGYVAKKHGKLVLA